MEEQENAGTEGILDSRPGTLLWRANLKCYAREDASSRIFGGSELQKNFINKSSDFPNVPPAPARTDDKTWNFN